MIAGHFNLLVKNQTGKALPELGTALPQLVFISIINCVQKESNIYIIII
jgi:hypothetical protein